MAEALRQGQKRRVVRSDINANETATFLIAAWEGYAVWERIAGSPDLAIRKKKRASPFGGAAPGARPDASVKPRLGRCLFEGWYILTNPYQAGNSHGFVRATDGGSPKCACLRNANIHTGRYYKATINDDCRIIGFMVDVPEFVSKGKSMNRRQLR